LPGSRPFGGQCERSPPQGWHKTDFVPRFVEHFKTMNLSSFHTANGMRRLAALAGLQI
jgi:hypothetical protein